MLRPPDADLLVHYAGVRWQYALLAERVRRFLEWKVKDFFEGVRWPALHLVQARAKSVKSLEQNLASARYDKKRRDGAIGLDDIGDLAAVRVIFYFEDDLVDFLGHLRKGGLSAWFGAGAVSGLDERLPPQVGDGKYQAFGYRSKHFPVRVNKTAELGRLVLGADNRFLEGLQCEVQLRTILQHSWAEAEHDLRYKGPVTGSAESRQWGVLAALVECADKLLAERKEYLFAAYPAPSREKGASGTPSPDEPGHVTLHDHTMAPLVLRTDRTLYSINERVGQPDFKRTVWDQLWGREPDLARAFTRDHLVVRVMDWAPATTTLTVQPAQYSDQLVTNHPRALDLVVHGRTVRSYAADAGGLLPFAESALANTIGVACMLRTAEGYWVLSRRGDQIAYEPGRWGCSISGALEWSELEGDQPDRLLPSARESIRREGLEELGIVLPREGIAYLALAREEYRAGKPQVFFVAETPLPNDGVRNAFRVNASDEHETIEFLSDADAAALVGAASWDGGKITIELRTALRLALGR